MKNYRAKLIGAVFGTLLLAAQSIPAAFATSSISLGTCQDLHKIGNDPAYPLDGSYVLTGNIDCGPDTSVSTGALWNGGLGFEPIGDSSNRFTGILNGQGFSISNLTIDRPLIDDVGLFGYAENATIENLRLEGGSVNGHSTVGTMIGGATSVTMQNVGSNTPLTGHDYTGGIIGSNETPGTSHLTNVWYFGGITAKTTAIGGIIGDSDGDANLTRVFSGANIGVSGPDDAHYVGGLVGDTDGILTIDKSIATGDITISNTVSDSFGGLVGWSNEDHITDSYATGAVHAPNAESVGGLLGYINTGTITNSYSAGEVTGDTFVGGFIGNQSTVAISGSFYDLDTSGQVAACGNVGGCDPSGIDDLTASEMTSSGPWTAAGWNFDDTWRQTASQNSGWPYLIWPVDHTALNPVSGKNAELVVQDGCNIDNMSLAAESSNATQDANYAYPQGLMNFTVACSGSSGFTTQVTQYYYGVSPGQTFVVRKYNPTTNTYSTIDGASVSYVTIGGQSVAKVVYSVQDGGSLDADGQANGVIVDPSGLALANPTVTTPGLPDTGLAPN